MKLKTIFSIMAVGLITCLSAQTSTNAIVFFESDSHTLSAEAITKLSAWVNDIGLKNVEKLTIVSHTDADGSHSYNKALSKRRSNSVYQYLESLSLKSKQLEIANQGEEKPVADNASESGKQQNRRVEIIATMVQPEYRDVKEKMGPPVQIFKESSERLIEIEGEGGVRVVIPANSLVDSTGKPVQGLVDITLTEYLNPSDFLFGGLHTQSGEELLETGGTIYIEINSKQGKLELKKGAIMQVGFPDREEGDKMVTFYGVEENGKLDWKEKASDDQPVISDTAFVISDPFPRTVPAESVDGPIKVIYEYENIDSSVVRELYEQNKLTDLMLKTTKLGWINCDRFSAVPTDATLHVNVDSCYHASVYLVFEKINSVMQSQWWRNDVEFTRIPSDEKVSVVALSYINDQPYYATRRLTTSANQSIDLALAPISEEELKTELKRLD